MFKNFNPELMKKARDKYHQEINHLNYKLQKLKALHDNQGLLDDIQKYKADDLQILIDGDKAFSQHDQVMHPGQSHAETGKRHVNFDFGGMKSPSPIKL